MANSITEPTAHAPHAPKKTIRLGCGEWGFRDLPMNRHFEIAHQFGFKVMEFGIGGGRTGRLSEHPQPEEVAGFLALAGHFNMATPFCCIENDFTLPDPHAHHAMMHKVLQQMQVAAACQASFVRLFAGFTPLAEMTEPLWQQLLQALETCQNAATDLGLTIAIETHGAITPGPAGEAVHAPTVTTQAQALQRLLAEMPPEIGMNFDPGNIKAAEGSADRLHLDVLDARINYCHLKDWKRVGSGWEAVAVGDDDLNYPPLLARMSYSGIYLVEYEPVHDVEAGIERSLKALQSLLYNLEF